MRQALAMLLSCVLGCGALPAVGQSAFILPGEERFTIILGTFKSVHDGKLRIDNSEIDQGTVVRLSNDLGMERDERSVMFGVEWRIARNHRIGISYSRFRLSGTRTVTKDLEIGDEIYPAGATVYTEFKIETIPIIYSYSLVRRDHDELAFTLGLHWTAVSASVQGSASANMQDVSADASADVNLPLPLFGLRYDHHFSPSWSAGLRTGAFAVKYSGEKYSAKGKVWNAAAYGEYRFNKHLGAGLGVEGFWIDVEGTSDQWNGKIDYWYWGPQIYLKARF